MGSQKYKNEQISVGHFYGKCAMGAKIMEMLQKFFFFFFFWCGYLRK